MDFVANTLLAVGAAPLISQDPRELKDLIQICHALYINLGTLNEDFLDLIERALALAVCHHKPVVLDPAGAGASLLRTRAAHKAMTSADLIRGNASEIMALSEAQHRTMGVESANEVCESITHADDLARRLNTTIVVSGPKDYVTDGKRGTFVTFGSPLMPCVTGMGCALTALMAGLRTVVGDSYEAGEYATLYFNLSGTLAAQTAKGPGTFKAHFIDELYAPNWSAIQSLYSKM